MAVVKPVAPRLGAGLAVLGALLASGCFGSFPWEPDDGPPAEEPGWRMLRGKPDHTGGYGTLTAGRGLELWNYTSPTPNASIPYISYAQDTIYATEYVPNGIGHMLALSALTGDLLWEYGLPHANHYEPVVANGLIYMIFNRDGVYGVYAIEEAALTTRWVYPFDAQQTAVYGPPAVGGGRVYFTFESGSGNATPGGGVYALDAQTGNLLWNRSIDDPYRESAIFPLTLHGNDLYVGTLGAYLYKLRADTGEIQQRFEFPGSGGSVRTPSVWNGTLFFVGGGSGVDAADATTGELAWSFVSEPYVFDPPVVADGMVFLHPWDGCIRGLDAATGQEIWSFPVDDRFPRCSNRNLFGDTAAPAYLDGVVFVAGVDDVLYALDGRTGNILWSTPLPGGGSPIVVNNVVYVAAGNKLHAIEWGGVPP